MSKMPTRVAILFSGGPAPAANAVISAAAVSFLRHREHKIEVVGVKYGYSGLMEFGPTRPLEEGRDYVNIDHDKLKRTRNSQGIMLGTARANPGKSVHSPEDLRIDECTAPLKTVYEALRSINVDALVSIGGDDTLKTANKFKLFQDRFPEDQRIPVVHLPKTIDNDYSGIDFTFGFFTAVNALSEEIRNLLFDAEASRSYFLAECMGRSAGWLAYASAIASEASLVLSVEDIEGDYAQEESIKNEKTGETETRKIMNIDRVMQRIVKTMLAREKEGKLYGVIVLAEGLAELLPASELEGISRDDHNHISISDVNLYEKFSGLIEKKYKEMTGGKRRRVKGLQVGYEARCAKPNAFDALLGSQLGVGAYRALVQKGLNGVMVSVKGQFDLHYVPFEELVDPTTLVTVVRQIETGSDFHQLARFLEFHIND